MPTIRASQGGEGIGIACPDEGWMRRLTVLELERLQGFPEGYTQLREAGADENDKQRRSAIGNTFAVPVVRWILNRIRIYAELSRERKENNGD